MRDNIKSNKVLLDDEANNALNEIISTLRGEGTPLKITRSKSCSWIIKEYLKNHFEKEKNLLIDAHFNKRSYILNVLNNTEDDKDLFEAVQGALNNTASASISKPLVTRKRRKNDDTFDTNKNLTLSETPPKLE